MARPEGRQCFCRARGEQGLAFRRGRGVSEKPRGLLTVSRPWRGEAAGRAACRQPLLLHTNYCSFATGEQQQATRSSSEGSNAHREDLPSQNAALGHVASKGSIRGITQWFPLPHHLPCLPSRKSSLILLPKMSAATSGQEMGRAHWAPPRKWKGSQIGVT